MTDETSRHASSQDAAEASGRRPKKPFEPPRLTLYGDIASLTRMVGRTGLSDGGPGASPTSKTRP